MAIGIQVARISLFSEGEYSVNTGKKVSKGGTFKNIHKKFPHWKNKQEMERLANKENIIQIPFYSHNIVENKHDGAVDLVIFTDHSSQSAREQEEYVKSLIKGANKYAVQITYKFMPINPDITDGGLFEQIAYRNGVYSKYKRLLNKATGNLTGDDFIDILEKSGIPLAKLRVIMRRDMDMMLKWLEIDIKQAYYFKATDVPTFFLNGQRLATPDLPLNDINSYVSRIVDGGDIYSAVE